MKQQEITALKIFESLEKDPIQTQRNLAKELNISLGLVNAFTKRLIQKGYIKIKTIPKNRIRYILTPKGMYEKTRLTYQYLLYSLEFYKETRLKIKSIYDQLSQQGKKRIYLIGVAELAEIALVTLQESELELAGIVDDEKAGNRLIGFPIVDSSKLKEASINDIILITKTAIDSELMNRIVQYGIKNNIVNLSNKYFQA